MIRPVRADGRIDAGGVFTPIYRSRVVDRIAVAAESRVVLIVAPAGYGKSTALRQYLDGVSEPVARYDLHSDNGSLLGFVRGFAEAINEIAPDARKTLSTAYDSARDSVTAGAELAMWMHAHIKTYNGTIAIDDLHVAENEKQVSAFISSLVDRTKGRVRWIIASRSFLDLPVGSWLAYQEMDLAVDESDLAFTAEEARSTARASRVGVRDEELESLVALTSGWPTALSFALRTSTRSLDLRNVAAVTREMVYRYLAEQVYEGLDAADRDLLATCALLPEIEIDILEAIGYGDALGMIEGLRSRVAFISPNTEKARVYRMHDLFRDFVVNRLEREGAAALAERRTTVARAMEKSGAIASALSIYADAGADADIARVIDDRGLQLFEEGHGDAILPALECMKVDGTSQNATALALRGLLESAQGRPEEAESFLRRAMRKATDRERRAQIELRYARISINRRGDPLEILRGIEADEDVLPDTRREAVSMTAVLLARAGRDVEAGEALNRSILAAESSEDPSVRARILQRVGLAASERGDAERALVAFQSATDLALREGLLSLASRCYTGLSNIMTTFFDDRTKNLWYAQQAHVAAGKAGDKGDMRTAALHLMEAEAVRGNAERVAALERLLGDLRIDAQRMKYVAASRAMRRGWEGSFSEAYRLLVDLWAVLPPINNEIANGAICAIFAAADGRPSEAAAIVTRVLALCEENRDHAFVSPFTMASSQMFCALAEALSGRHTAGQKILRAVAPAADPATESLRAAVSRASRVLKGQPSELAELEEEVEALRDFGCGGYGMLVRAAVTKVLSDSAGATAVSLTRAEIAVLRSLAGGRTPKEIAAETGRSVYTVQAHIQNAIEKLGCHGRQEAITLARRIGVVSTP
jgi:ATP/maltotriose-dependent transcriptional regulator MalT